MNNLVYLIPSILGILFAAAAGLTFWGMSGAFVAAFATLSLISLLHIRQMYKLLGWLKNPEPESIPFANGIWDEVFSTLLKQSRNRRKQKRKLKNALMRFNRAAEALPTGVMILDKEMRIEWQNRLSATHFNLNRERVRNGILAQPHPPARVSCLYGANRANTNPFDRAAKSPDSAHAAGDALSV
ncbi:phosphate regulon sensor protein PhoR [Neisseria weixii]|uniref:DUF3329 domain-containing protein n=1 Tax=Neisseria weixii TaxID=1853276 RepID=A0A3N4MNJ2_9NEIS|nr:DUF3329 domain-containing protein [Neisseria weixii]ATD65982.1 hypothetical protein CGZ65_08265 [Neisseria weixii]RPD84778.1 DUF3329 domain-containing protein [Neisseria weixii]RPD85553.1 DUF3329 domain-containing protein [Neisseria weixii]